MIGQHSFYHTGDAGAPDFTKTIKSHLQLQEAGGRHTPESSRISSQHPSSVFCGFQHQSLIMSSFSKDPREAEFTLIQLASNYPSNNQAGSWVSCDLVNDIIFHTEAGTSLIKLHRMT